MSATEHATVHGSPGEGARMAGLGRAIWPLLAAVFATGTVMGATLGPYLDRWVVGVFLVLAGLLLWRGVFVCRSRVAAFFKGAAGEEIVARELSRLPVGYHVFHALDAGGGLLMWRGGDMDHVVAGPSGVFVVETKNWRGEVSLSGNQLQLDGAATQRNPLEQVRAAVSQLQVRLGRCGIYHVNVVPVVCFVNDRFAPGCQTVGEVVVCNAACLLAVLTDATRDAKAGVDVDGIVRVLQAGRTE